MLVQKTNIIFQEKSLNYKQLNKARNNDIKAIKAFLGLVLLAGIYHSNGLNLDDLWNPDGTGVEIFRLTMSLHRFGFLLCCLQFDDKPTRLARREVTKLASIRELFDMFFENCLKNYTPTELVTIDEMLMLSEENVHLDSTSQIHQLDME